MAKEQKRFMIEDAQLIFRNFSGEATKFNREGDRNFSAILPSDVAEQMENDGWNVKWLEPREEGEDRTAYIQIAVNYKNRPPRVIMITSKSRTLLTEAMVGLLDSADFATVDLICNGYEWDVNEKTGVKAYLKTMFVTINEDELELKYAIAGDSTFGTPDVGGA